MESIAQIVINGISLGSIYAMVALGFTLVFGVVQMINFAHTEFYMIGAFILYYLFKVVELPFILSGVVSVIILGVFGYLMRKVLRLEPDLPFETMVLITLGASITLQNAGLAVFGNTARSASIKATEGTVAIGSAVISYQRLIILGASIISFIVVDQMLRRTKIGKAMRAVAQNQVAARVVGIDAGMISSITFVLAVGLAGLAGVLVAPAFFILPTMGVILLPKCFAVTIMGGRGNVRGAFISSFGLGLVESFSIFYVGAGFRDIFAFVLLIAVLVARPEGLFGKRVGLT